MSRTHLRWLAVVLVVVMVLPMLLACGSPPTPKEPAAGGQATVAEPTVASGSATSGGSSGSSGGGSGDPSKRASDALGLLTGSGSEGPALPSCHVELTSISPAWDSDAKAVKTNSTSIQADMQGKNVHLFYQETQTAGGETKETGKGEGIVVGGENKEYEIVDGQAKESLGIGMVWVAWPLEPGIALVMAALGTAPQGSESVDGRAADVYAVDMAKADPAVLKGVQGFIGKGFTKAAGKVWVDHETGALLKAVLGYELDLYEMGGEKALGHGAGHFELLVTKVGQVAVQVPAGS